MTPRAKVLLYGALIGILPLEFVTIILALGHHFPVGTVVGVVAITLTTFFASSSKFAKEVFGIIEWKRVSHRPFNEYPQTEELYFKALERLAQYARMVKRKRTQFLNLRMRRRQFHNKSLRKIYDDSLNAAMIQADVSETNFRGLWNFLKTHRQNLPVDPFTKEQWEDPEGHLNSASIEDPASEATIPAAVFA